MSADMGDYTDELVGRASRTEGGHLSIGRAGFTLHYDRGCTLRGYDCERMKALCLARGLPLIDSRTVPFEAVSKLAVSGPMTAVGHAGTNLLGTPFPMCRCGSWRRPTEPPAPRS